MIDSRAVSTSAAGAKLGAAALPHALRGSGYELVKDWDFGRTVRTAEQMRREFYTRYVYEGGTRDTLNDEWQHYRDSENHVFDSDGVSLVARIATGLRRGGIESGMLRSKWIGQYGYFEISVRVPRERGMWPAFWINPNDEVWPPEIDVFEFVNNGKDSSRNSFHFLHFGNGSMDAKALESRLSADHSYRPGFDFADAHHTIAALWLPGQVSHFVDDKLVAAHEFDWAHPDGSDGGPAHVLVNLAVGGGWPGAPVSEDDFPASLHIRHIRVWQDRRISPPCDTPAEH